MLIKSSAPFEMYKVYQTVRQSDGRKMVTLVHLETKANRRMTFARYLLATKIGRELTKQEHADHIDGNKTNDSIDNLQILTPQQNQIKAVLESGRSQRLLTIVCPECKQTFERFERDVKSKRKNGHSSFCSRACSGKHSTRKRTWRPVKQA